MAIHLKNIVILSIICIKIIIKNSIYLLLRKITCILDVTLTSKALKTF